MNKDYYKILGVAEFESAENIKNAYRKLARKWHPDIAGSSEDVMLRFKEINEAYEILSNNVKKMEYDKARRFYNYANQTSNNDLKKENNSSRASNPHCEKFNFNWKDFFAKNDNETATRHEQVVPKRGEDLNSDIEISIFEAMSGTTKVINMLQTTVCPKCKGKKFANNSLCTNCNGKGEKTSYKKFTVKIPAGIKNGSKIRLSGEGGLGLNGGNNGDLYITVHVLEPLSYKTDGLNILKTMPITPFEAVLGGNIEVSTLKGKLNVKLAPNSQSGQKIRLANCGIVQNEKVGDMIITLEIKIPRNITQEEIELYKKLESISKCNIREE